MQNLDQKSSLKNPSKNGPDEVDQKADDNKAKGGKTSNEKAEKPT